MSCMRIQGSSQGWGSVSYVPPEYTCMQVHAQRHTCAWTHMHPLHAHRNAQHNTLFLELYTSSSSFWLYICMQRKKLNQTKTKPQNIQESIQYCEEENSNYLQIIENSLKGHSYRDKGLLARTGQISGAAEIHRNPIIRSSARQPLQQTVLRKLQFHVFKIEMRL